MTITFVNRFTVNGASEDFERAFNETADFIRRQPGLLRYTLSRDVRDSSQYINVAHWDTAESLKVVLAHPDFASHAATLRSLATSEGTLYDDRIAYEGQAATAA
jgi:heme-degrading monooxygenase HmoA